MAMLKSNLVTGLKNPAIWIDENGAKHLKCVRCGTYIGNEYTMDYYSLIRRKYCDKCKMEKEAEWKAQYMRDARKNKRLLHQQNRKLEAENKKLRELNAEVDSRITELEAELEALKAKRNPPVIKGKGLSGLLRRK